MKFQVANGDARIDPMTTDIPPNSPFQAPQDVPPSTEPEQPRLGIIHLMGWTACVAVQFSVGKTFPFVQTDSVLQLEPSLILAVGAEIGRGTALGGLLLLVVRRYRRLPFPSQPGEWLLVLLGIRTVTAILQRGLLFYMAPNDTMSWQAFSGFGVLISLLMAVLYVLAAVKTRILRWRVYFVAALVAGVMTVILPFLVSLVGAMPPNTPKGLAALHQSPWLALSVLLLYVAVKDAGGDVPFRWPHWLGVGIALWNAILLVAWIVLLF